VGGGESYIVEKNPDYYKGEPYLDQIVYRVMPSGDARLAALRTGEAHMTFFLVGEDVLNAREIPGVNVYETPAHCAFFFLMNLRNPIFRDPRTRRALNHAIDKESIVGVIAHGLGSVKWGPIARPSWAFIDPEHKYTYDPEEAKALLEEAGWIDTDGDGIREAHGVEVAPNVRSDHDEDGNLIEREELDVVGEVVPDGTKLAWTILNIAGQLERLQICQIAQQQWRVVGAEVDINTVDVSTFVGTARSFDFGMAYLYNQWSTDPGLAVGYTWHPDGHNWHGLDTMYPDVTDILDAARATVDVDERKALYAEFQELMAERVPDILMYDRMWYNAVSEKVHNFKPIPGGEQQTWNAYEWWLEP
jgi:peptide/nickel transport system substrate-binding protein